ncbi:hypothetical protein [Mobiluncus curtisii]|uniref:Uncharacterized protein n=1 Tax=Mobiluncus curtisii (strain ATCC 43063 / DSM 2711 / V125) TaxID=548479 RepID=D6ZKB3_MOBCV|nr:hypothetical protein [Mobiluncus curtisii]ADI67162.1 hypothetical protein HMPREF0573_10843 [Mobiluncus curtisii ATCC 43063]
MRIAPVHKVGDEARSQVVRLPAGARRQRTHRAAEHAMPPDLGS